MLSRQYRCWKRIISSVLDYWRKPTLFSNVGISRISSLADMDTIWVTHTHHYMGGLSCSNPDFIEKNIIVAVAIIMTNCVIWAGEKSHRPCLSGTVATQRQE